MEFDKLNEGEERLIRAISNPEGCVLGQFSKDCPFNILKTPTLGEFAEARVQGLDTAPFSEIEELCKRCAPCSSNLAQMEEVLRNL